MNYHSQIKPNSTGLVAEVTAEQTTTGSSNGHNITSTPSTSTAGMSIDYSQPSTSGYIPSQLGKRKASSAPGLTDAPKKSKTVDDLAGTVAHIASNLLHEDVSKNNEPEQSKPTLQNTGRELNHGQINIDAIESMDVTENDNDETPIFTPCVYETINMTTDENLLDFFKLPEVSDYDELERHTSFPQIKSQFLHDIQELKKLAPYFVGNAFNWQINHFYNGIKNSDEFSESDLLMLYKEVRFHLRSLLTTLKRYQNEYQKNDIDSKQKDYIATVLRGCLEGIDQCAAGICGRFRYHFIDLQASESGLEGKIFMARKKLLQNCVHSFITIMKRKKIMINRGDMEIHQFYSIYNIACDSLQLPPIADDYAIPESALKKYRTSFNSLAQLAVSKCAILKSLSKEWSDKISTILQQEGVSTWETKDIPLSALDDTADILETLDNKIFKPLSTWLGKTEKNGINTWSLMDQKDDDTYSFARYPEKLFAWVTGSFRESKDKPLNEPKTTVFASSTPNTTNPNLHIGTIGGDFFWLFNDEQPLKAGDPCTFESDNHITLELSHLTPEHLSSDAKTNYAILTQALEQTNKAEDIASFFMNPLISSELYKATPWLTCELSNQLTDKLAHQKDDKFQTILCKCVCNQVMSYKTKVVTPVDINWLIGTQLLKPVLLELQQHKIDITPITQGLSSWQISEFSESDIKRLLAPKDCQRLCMEAHDLGQQTLVCKLCSTGHCGLFVDYLNTRRNALHYFAHHGILHGLERILARDDTNVNSEDDLGNTPLNYAAQFGHVACVEKLLSIPRIQVNAANNSEETPLHQAAMNGHVNCVSALLKQSGTYVNATTNSSSTALHEAAKAGQLECVKLLLKAKGILPNEINIDDHTALSIACRNGHEKCVVELLAAGADYKPERGVAHFPLHLAAKRGHIKCCEALLTAGAMVNTKDVHGNTPLNYAAAAGHVECVNLLLGATEVQLNITDEFGHTALSNAAKKGHAECIAALLAAGAESETKHEKGCSLLHIASKYGHIKCAEVLLANAAKANMQDNTNNTPLNLAATFGHVGCVKLLLGAKGVQLNLTDEFGHTALSNAAQEGHAECIVALLAAGAAYETKHEHGCSPLHIASKHGHIKCAEVLLAKAANPNMQDSTGNTLLNLAAEAGHVGCVKLLSGAEGVQLDITNNFGHTALSNAAKKGHAECIAALLAAGANTITQDAKGNTPLNLAAKYGHLDCVKLLLGAKAVCLDAIDKSGHTALSNAAKNGHAECVKELLAENDAMVHSTDRSGRTALSHASENGCLTCISALLTARADINMADETGNTPMHYAVMDGRRDCIEHLLINGAIITNQNSVGWTPLHLSADAGHINCCGTLVRAGAPINTQDSHGYTPLLLAAQRGHKECVTILLDKGANTALKENDNGCTPLHFAAESGYVDCVESLLGKGANINTQNNHDGHTPLHLAAIYGRNECLDKMLRSTTNVEMKTKEGYTALELAAMHGNVECVKLLASTTLDLQRALILAVEYDHEDCISLLKKHALGTSGLLLKLDNSKTLYDRVRNGCSIS
ncbi:MAG: ankyrin repeat domain-containing protein [Candidatus Endonucleobacter sp. (ex Gigantidas childressi)]|nr:ankyrin repeat domain-containing protein [Candidatus Endonucleobacter sp. (ex Gigantidas childressi)]